MAINRFKFILSATTDDESRYYLSAPYYDADAQSIISTDGRHLHMWKLSADMTLALGLEASGYLHIDAKKPEVFYNKKLTDMAKFPNWQQAIPEYKKTNDNYFELFLDCKKDIMDMNIPKFIAQTGVALNLQYLRDLYGANWQCLFNSDKEIRAYKPALFTYDDLTAVIMPLLW